MRYYMGGHYEGEWKNDKRNGQGERYYFNESITSDKGNNKGHIYFEGSWVDDKMEGQGRRNFYHGTVYVGK